MKEESLNDSWSEEEMEDYDANQGTDGYTMSQVEKVEYNALQRRKLDAKEFPQRVDATDDEEEEDPPTNQRPVEHEAVSEHHPSSASTIVFADETAPSPLGSIARTASSFPSPSSAEEGYTAPTPSLPIPKTRLQFTPLALPPTNDDGFAQVIRERSQQRKAKEDAALSALRVQVSRLESAIAAESKRRVNAIKQLQQKSKQAVEDMQERLESRHAEEMKVVNERLSSLEERMSQLESSFSNSINDLDANIEEQHNTLSSQLRNIQSSIQYEAKMRNKQHEQFLSNLQCVTDSYLDRWKTERQERMTVVNGIYETFEKSNSDREQDVQSFEGKLKYELSQLQQALALESEERQYNDQDIVNALNRYTKQLQDSLAAAVAN